MKLADLQQSNASVYYFKNVTGYHMRCNGVPGVRLHILASPVRIMVKGLVREQGKHVAEWRAKEGQAIKLTWVPTWAAKLNSNPGYIWYRNRLQLNSSRTNSYLSLDPITYEDTGIYVCVLIGYEDLPSPAVNLTVQRRSSSTVSAAVSEGGSKMDNILSLTHGFDAFSATEQLFNYQKFKSLFTVSIMLAATV